MALSSPVFCATCGAANDSQASACFACGLSLHIPQQSWQPVLRQRYHTLCQLGQGGMGAVYKAEDTELGNRLVAVKEMSQRGLNQQEEREATEAFKREAHLLAGLMHPNLPRIYDHFSERGRWYLVMDFIEGQTLEDYLEKAPGNRLPLKEVLEIGIQLCTVLDYLHTRQPPIIFRDLKPSNVMRTPHGQLYLIDFGIARHFKPGQAKDTAAFGSPGYAAPEQYGKTQTAPQADLYSLGAIMHQMLTGHDPSATPFFFDPLPAGTTPVDLHNLLVQMLAMDIRQRPISATLVKEALQRLAAQELTGQIQLAQPGTKINGSQTSGVFAPQNVSTTAYPAYRRVNQVSTSMGQPLSSNTNHSDWISALAWSPDGSRVASGSYDQTVQVWDISKKELLVYKDHIKRWWSGRVTSVAWSPDGRCIASTGDDKTVHIWEVATGEKILIYKDHQGKALAVAWSPDGELLASASDYIIQVWEAATGNPIISYSKHTNVIRALAWSPDGTYLASASCDGTVRVCDATQWDRDEGTRTIYNKHNGDVQAIAWSPDGSRIASASIDDTVHIWDALTGNHILTYTGHPLALKAVAWSPDGKYIASGGTDENVQIWDALTSDHIFTYHKHAGNVHAVAWSPDSTCIASGGVDQIVRVWRAL